MVKRRPKEGAGYVFVSAAVGLLGPGFDLQGAVLPIAILANAVRVTIVLQVILNGLEKLSSLLLMAGARSVMADACHNPDLHSAHTATLSTATMRQSVSCVSLVC